MDSYFAFGMVDSFACLNIYSYYKRMEAEVKGVGETIKTKGTSLLASLGPYAGALSMLRRMQTKKGAVSNCFVSVLRCQRGLNSSRWSSDSAAKGGQWIGGAKR